jgi:hypothetical protein
VAEAKLAKYRAKRNFDRLPNPAASIWYSHPRSFASSSKSMQPVGFTMICALNLTASSNPGR